MFVKVEYCRILGKRRIKTKIDMVCPNNVKELHQLLGMVRDLAMVNLFQIYHLIHLEKDSIWCFINSHRAEVTNLRKLVTTTQILKFFNPELPIKISCVRCRV